MTQPVSQQGLTAAQLAQLLALVQAQAKVRQQLTQTAVAAAVAVLRGFTGWWQPRQVDAAVRKILAVLQPSQRQAARVTDAYLSRALTIMTGRTVRPVGAVDITQLRHLMPVDIAQALVDGKLAEPLLLLGDTHDGPGPDIAAPLQMVAFDAPGTTSVAPAKPYERVAEQVRVRMITQGEQEKKARAWATVRIAALAENDVTMAVRAQAQANLLRLNMVIGYRRILHPELSESGPCGLCVVAADRIYSRSDLLPIHARCKCEVLPMLEHADPGLNLNADDLERLYKAAGSTGGGKRQGGALKRIRVALGENTETGPVLFDADQHYRGPAQVATTIAPNHKPANVRAQLASLEKSLARLEAEYTAGQNVLTPLTWQRNRVAELRRELAELG